MQKLRNVSIKEIDLELNSEEASTASIALDSESGTMFTITSQAKQQKNFLVSFPSQANGQKQQQDNEEEQQDQSKSQDQKNQQNKNETDCQVTSHKSPNDHALQSIESQKTGTVYREIFGNTRDSLNSRSVLPQESIVIDGKEVHFTDTFSQPTCLRFCPASSNKQMKISQTGLTVQALANNQKALGNMAFSEGVHYWEIICPVSASTMRIGVVSKGTNQQEILQGFRTTTPRTVGVELDIPNRKLRYWLNGQYLRKERSKDLPPNIDAWIPCVDFAEKNFVAILNPFVNMPALTPDKKDMNSRMPTNIANIKQVQLNYLTEKLSGYLYIHGLLIDKAASPQGQDKLSLIKSALKFEDCDTEFTVTVPDPSDKQPEPLLDAALLQFKNRREALIWLQIAMGKLPTPPKVIDSRGLATAMLQLKNDTVPEASKGLLTKQKDFFMKYLIPESIEEQILSGLDPQTSLSLEEDIQNLKQKLQASDDDTQKVDEESKDASQSSLAAKFSEFNFTYLQNSNTIVVASGDEIKAFPQENLPEQISFSNYPQMPRDIVALCLNKQDMVYILEKLNFLRVDDRHTIKQFFNYASENYQQDRFGIPYAAALQAVLALLEAAQNQYKEIEELGFKLQERDFKPTKNNELDFETGGSFCSKQNLSIVEANRLLNILLNLEDQLWSMTLTDQTHSSVKNLWPVMQARIHTAYGRLCSNFFNTDNIDMKSMSNLGLIQRSKLGTDTKFFQDLDVKIENTFENNGNPLLCSLEKQLVHNYLIQGKISWNVDLSNTMNALPPSVHKSNNKRQGSKDDTDQITSIKTLEESNYLMTTSKEGSVNVWSSDLGLKKAGGAHFMAQKFLDPESKILQQWKLPMQSASFQTQTQNDVDIHMKTKDKIKYDKPKESSTKKNEEIGNNLNLGNLFDEDEDEAVADDENNSICYQSDDENDLPSKLHLTFYDAVNDPVKKTLQFSDDKVEKETKVPSSNPEVEDPKIKEILKSIQSMGFTQEQVMKAIQKIKDENKEVNVSEVTEQIFAMQTEEADQKQTEQPIEEEQQKEVEYKVYNCDSCTYLNENPKATCEVCGANAPESALKVPELTAEELKEIEDAKIKKQQEEEEKQKAEEIAARVQRELQEKKNLAEQKKIQMLQEQKQLCLDYYNQSEIVDYLFASCEKGVQRNPLLTGAYFLNKQQKTCDLHLVSFAYKLSYMQSVTQDVQEIPQVEKAFMKMLANSKKSVESYYPTLMGQEQTDSNWTPETNKQESTTLTHQKVGVVRMQFDSIDSICQVGNDISELNDTQILVIVIGRKDGKQKSTVLKISQKDNKFQVDNMEDLSKSLNTIMQDEEIISLHYVSRDRFLSSTSGTVIMLKKEKSELLQVMNELGSKDDDTDTPLKYVFKIVWTLNYEENTKVVNVQNGLLSLKEDDKFSFFTCSEIFKKLCLQHKERTICIQSEEQQQVKSKEEVIKMKIEPAKVSVTDLNQYENLMNSQVAPAHSNANQKQGQIKHDLYMQHTWNVKQESYSQNPFQLEFKNPTSLISLNLDLTFQCNNNEKLLELLNKNEQSNVENESEEKSLQIDTTDKAKKQSNEQSSNQVHNLGLFTLSSFDEDKKCSPTENKDSNKSAKQDLIPLIVKHNTGCVYNANYMASKILVNDQSTYSSNYARPELVFQHSSNQRMNVEQVVLRSAPNTKSGAFPLGEGLIFLADTMQPLQQTGAFSQFKQADYIAWREERLRDDSRPLRPEEPVGYFNFDERNEITFDLDFKRSARYIMIKPTGFRTKPHAFNQSFNTMPVEIVFFGAIGQTTTEPDQVLVNDPSQNMGGSRNILTDYEVEIKVLNNDNTLQRIDNIKIDQLKLFEKTLSPNTIVNNAKAINKTKLLGIALHKMTDSSLQLQKIKGVSLQFKHKNEAESSEQLWSLVSAQIQGYESMVSSKDDGGNSNLFGNEEIPSSYYRSCLMSPTFFPVVNQQLACMVSSDQYPQKLRIRLMLLLQKIIKINDEFLRLVFEQIQLKEFIRLNIQNQNHSTITSSVEFLRHFQNEPEFCKTLYEILLEKIEEIPSNFMLHEGYNALIGMIKWAMPLDYQRVLDALIKTLYNKVCKDKIRQVQTKEAIQYKTRINQNQYPFDHKLFKGVTVKDKTTSESTDPSAQSNSNNEGSGSQIVKDPSLLTTYTMTMQHSRLQTVQDVTFFAPVEINSIKVFFDKQIKDKFSLSLQVLDGSQIIYEKYLDPTALSQYTTIPYLDTANKNSDHAFTITGIQHTVKRNLQVVIMMYVNALFMSQAGDHQAQGIKFVSEFYGTVNEKETEAMAEHVAQIKNMQGASAQKLCFGKSINFLTTTKDNGKILVLTPQEGSIDTVQAKSNEASPDNVTESQSEQINTNNESSSLQMTGEKDGVVVSSENQKNLKAMQQELKEEINSNGRNVFELVKEIERIQNDNMVMSQLSSQTSVEAPSHQQLNQIVCDFTRLIRVIQNSNSVKKDAFVSSFRSIASAQEGLDTVCLDMFESFVVNEAGETQSQALSFLNESVMPLLTRQEKRNFFIIAIGKFLQKPDTNISQAAVVKALDSMSICEADLATYLAQKLGFNSDQEVVLDENPMALMSSVLILIQKQLERVDIPEHGKVVHKGVSCSLCQKKMIVGWLYKCANCNCESDINFDQECALKHQEENPNHVMIIIKEPLPAKKQKNPKSPTKTKQGSKPFNSILPEFKFKEQEAGTDTVVHTDVSCNKCQKQQIEGNCYKCANCEDWNLCEKCYFENKYTHFKHHVFIKLHKPLLQADQTPVALLQLLDSRLTSPDQAQFVMDQNNEKQNEVVDEDFGDDEDFEDLAPLGMSRSISVPVDRVKGIKKQSESIDDSAGQMDYDQMHKTIFKVIVWICKDTKFFSQEQKTALLRVANLALTELGKVASVKALADLSEDRDSVMVFVTTVLRINNKQLLADYEAQLNKVLSRLRTNHTQIVQEIITSKDKKLSPDLQARKDRLIIDLNEKKRLTNRLISIYQILLQCLIDVHADPENTQSIAKISNSKQVQTFIELCQKDKKMWLENMNFMMELSIQLKNENSYIDKLLLKSLQDKENQKKSNGLQPITEELLPIDEDADLLPIGMNRSLSHPVATVDTTDRSPQQAGVNLIKSFINMLHHQNEKQQSEEDSRLVSGIWMLTLRSLTTVSARVLVESHLVDQLMNVFLVSSNKIQQTMFPQILKISQTIVKYSIEQGGDHARFICSLLFNTLESILNNPEHELVGYQICRGWLDILKEAAHATDPTKSKIGLEPEDVSQMLQQASKYLVLHLNKGTFEGSAGAQPMIVMRLQMIDDMLRMVMVAQSGKKLALQELFARCESDAKTRKEFSSITDRLLTWLFLNGVRGSDHAAFNTINTLGQKTPASHTARKITSNIKAVMKLISDCVQNTEAIKIALKSIQTIIKKMNQDLVKGAESQSIGFDSCLKMSRKTNKLHKNLLSCWLVSEDVVNYYVFDLQGFEFLLDCIGQEKSQQEASNIESKPKSIEEKKDEKMIADAVSTSGAFQDGLIFGSDIDQLLGQADDIINNISSLGTVKSETKEKADLGSISKESKESKSFSGFHSTHAELAKTMVLQSTNMTSVQIQNYQKTDWSANKKGVKNQIITQYMTEMKNNEITMHFKLPYVALIREIQVGFLNYRDSAAECYTEPYSILVEAGMDKDNLNQVCNLEVIKDNSFAYQTTSVFGKNIQEYTHQNSKVLGQSIDDIIQSKLNSLNNFTIQYIKFSVRKNVVTCVENSMLSTRFEKRLCMALNFISITGYKAEGMSGYGQYMKGEQKKTALEVMSLICAGNFSSALKVIANQQQNIDKLKSQFDAFVNLVATQSSMIEPTFIGISSYNKDMGDWILNKFLTVEGYDKHADLAGKIIICDKEQVANRVRILIDSISEQMETLQNKHAKKDLAERLQRFVIIAVKIIHQLVPHLTEEIDFKIKDSTIINIFSSCQDQSSQNKLQLTQFACLLVNPPTPFINSAINQELFFKGLSNEVLYQQHSQAMKHIMIEFIGLIAAQSSQIADSLYESRTLLDQIIETSTSADDRIAAIQAWISISKDNKVRAKLQTEKLPTKLYNFMKEEDPVESKRIIKQGDQDFNLMAQLLKQVIVGNDELENELASLIINDIKYLGTNRDEFFINKIFLPLIKNEQYIPVCIHESVNKEQWNVNFDMISFGANNQKQKQDTSASFLPSTLLKGDARKDLIKAVQQVVGSQSKSKADQLMQAQWTNVHSTTEKMGSHSTFQNLWTSMQGKGPFSMLFSFKRKDNKKSVIFGSYCSQMVPSVPENFNSDEEFIVTSTDSDFVWCYQEGIGFTVLKPMATQPIMEFFTDYDGGGAISVAGDYMIMSFGHDFSIQVGYTEILTRIGSDTYPIPKTDMLELEKQEIWIANLQQKGQSSTSVTNKDIKVKTQQMTGQYVFGNYEPHQQHPWIQIETAYQQYRAKPVFMVPSHLKMSQVAKILLSEGVLFEIAGQAKIQDDKNLSELYSEFMQDLGKSEKQNNILDLTFDIDQVYQSQNSAQDNQTLSMAEKIALQYAPQQGFYSQYEKLGGVKSFISVTIASLQLWNDKKLAESWQIWLTELQSFSEMPMFFQQYLSNHTCKELIFKVLNAAPDQDSKDEAKKKYWDDQQKNAVQFNYKILAEIFTKSQDKNLRQIAIENDFLPRILHRLGLISGEKPREYEETKEEEQILTEENKESEEKKTEEVKNVNKKKRGGVGYSSKQGVTFDVTKYLENKQVRNQQIMILVDIVTSFFDTKEWKAGQEVVDQILSSALLPLLENSFRNGSWLDMAKEDDLYHSLLALTRAIASQKELAACLIEIDANWKPKQTGPIYKLLEGLNGHVQNFLICLNKQQVQNEKQEDNKQEQLANDFVKTHEIVEEAVEKLLGDKVDEEEQIADALSLPIDLQYRALLSPLRFDYMDMRQNNDVYKHKYDQLAKSNQSPPTSKIIRLSQELADLANALPAEHTNSVFVRVDQSRIDVMKAIITGATDTPYAHGCYEFDLFCENNYPNGSPKMNLMTTGGGNIRFNPNLYACGKVCLSLLGTWRGNATENWDPKLSTILQVLLSTQAIVMSQEVYFNEPGFEGEAGTPEGERKNEGYMNIVRYGNVKWAMLGQLKNPSKGFETAIKRHFYVKKAEILTEVNEWLKLADVNEASYNGLVNEHNQKLAADMKASKTKYKEMLQSAVNELTEELNKLEAPSNYQIKPKEKKKKRQQKKKEQSIAEGQATLDDVDMGDDDCEMIDTTKTNKEIDVEDDTVKDRWSRYIGAMGVEAVAKQAAANIFVSGAGGLGMEISKNLVLAGCKSFTLHDTKTATYRDLSAQFFLSQVSKDKTRAQACMPKLQQLNYYVKCKVAPSDPLPLNEVALDNEPWNFKIMDVIVLSECDYETNCFVNAYCHARGKKFISTDIYGVCARVFNDFGKSFEVLDKNGEEMQDVIIESISNEEKGIVTLPKNVKHGFEDGDEVMFTQVAGMKLKQGEKHSDPAIKSDSINETIHKITVISVNKFTVGDTRMYEQYDHNGICKQLRTKQVLEFKTFKEVMLGNNEDLSLDQSMVYSDFTKMANTSLSHVAFEALDTFKKEHKRMPGAWNKKDADIMFEMAKKICIRYEIKPEEFKEDSHEISFFYLFSFTAQGVFNPMCAFFGGYIAQEAIKAITNKFSPTKQLFYYDATEVLPSFKPEEHLKDFENYLKSIQTQQISHRSDGLRICVGNQIVEKLAYTRLFMVGAGAIGCELLKNYAMLGVGVGKKTEKNSVPGSIVLTDPDIIELSNLNRQFLFREKHLRMPKSQTAAAAAIHMNNELKNNIIARLDRVSENTSHIYTDKFFEDLTCVTNALDNVKARKYIDARCVTAQTPLLESGTLGPKGHVQVILPFQTESYGSQEDPEDNNEIPMCTLKMFPEETIHCVEWAREKFGTLYNLKPKNLQKILEEGESVDPISSEDIQSLKKCVKMLNKRPKSFGECVEYARLQFEKLFSHAVRQLIYTYPLDAKTKEGNLFWTLPKRPPTHIEFDKNNLLHATFIQSMACLRANIFLIEIPDKKPRSNEFKLEVANMASQCKVAKFVPNDEKAKEIQSSVDKASKETEEENKEEQKEEVPEENNNEIENLKKEFIQIYKGLKIDQKKPIEEQLVKAEEFEKDDDSNFHIDFMYALGNLRAENYKLDPMDWIQVKLKAGRIVPALATTTAAVAGLQTLEMLKILKDMKLDQYKNIFMNLAVPCMQASEPGNLEKIKLLEGVEVTLWDKWEIKDAKNMTLEAMITELEERYKGLIVRNILRGNAPLYLHAIMNAQGKQEERKQILQTSVKELTECEKEDLYVDLNVTCIRSEDKDNADAQIVKGVPVVRVYF